MKRSLRLHTLIVAILAVAVFPGSTLADPPETRPPETGPPETWTLDFTASVRVSIPTSGGTLSIQDKISGRVRLSIGRQGALTGRGTMSVTESCQGPTFSSQVSGKGAVSVTGRRDGPQLIFRFSGKEFPLKGTMHAAGMNLAHESQFNPEIPAPVRTVIARKGGVTTSMTHRVGGGTCTSRFTLLGGQNVVEIAPVDPKLHPMTNIIWILTFGAKMTTHGKTITMTGRAEFPLPEKDGPARGTGTLEMKGPTEYAKGTLILDGWIKDGVLTFIPRGTFQTVTSTAGKERVASQFESGVLAFGETESISLPVEGGAERVIPFGHAPSKSSGRFTWRLLGRKHPKLVELRPSKEAKRTGIVKPKNWAAVKRDSDPIIVTAVTDPNTPRAWKKIKWGGDAGAPIDGQPNKRRLSRAASKKYHVVVELGGATDHADVWILWATLETLTSKSDTTPPNSPKYKDLYGKFKLFDNTETLGPCFCLKDAQGAGKTAHIAQLTPKGVNEVVTGGWKFRRKKLGCRWANEIRRPNWTTWTRDLSTPDCLDERPDTEDRIYDIDAPTIGGKYWKDTNEAYINFKQYVEWDEEICSDVIHWHWKARWESDKDPSTVFMDVGKGWIKIPKTSYYGK